MITDGEFRRATWHLDFMWGFEGAGHKKTETGLPFHGEAAMIDDTFVTGKIRLAGEHPFVSHFRFVKALEDENTVAKQTIPSPAQMFAQFWIPFGRLSTKKSPKLEDKETVIARIRDAAQFVPLERLYLSPQCGFASCEIGNKLTEEDQWAKLALVKEEIAEEVWGK